MICNINGYNVLIEEFNDGFGWQIMPDRTGVWIEGEGSFKTEAECQQDAMRFVSEQEAEEREEQEPDNYRAEQTQLFDRRDYQ